MNLWWKKFIRGLSSIEKSYFRIRNYYMQIEKREMNKSRVY